MATIRDTLRLLLATSCGLGFLRPAPGTMGTLPAVAAFVAIRLWAPETLQPWLIGALLALSCAGMVWLGPWAERRWNRKDPQMVVLDEVAGFLTTVLLFRPDPDRVSLLALTVWAFAMTRFFDILKPPPVHLLERLPHGWGILLDDVAASLYAVAALWILYRFCPVLFAF